MVGFSLTFSTWEKLIVENTVELKDEEGDCKIEKMVSHSSMANIKKIKRYQYIDIVKIAVLAHTARSTRATLPE